MIKFIYPLYFTFINKTKEGFKIIINKKVGIPLVIFSLLLISIVHAGFLDWFKGLDWITGGASTGATTPNATIGNLDPILENVTYQSGLGANNALNEGAPTTLIFSMLLGDGDGDDDVDNGSISLNVTLDGGDTRENNSVGTDPSCYPESVGGNETTQNYTCTIIMEHWDFYGDWTCTAVGGDGTVNATVTKVENCFTVTALLAFNMTSSNITWSNLAVGQNNNMMVEDELNITNTANQNISNVTIKAYDLIGEKSGYETEYIGADNFTAAWGERLCNWDQWTMNGTDVQILYNATDTTNNKINFGPGSDESTNNATHICLEHVGDSLYQQAYSTIGNTLDAEKYWTITGSTGAV